MLRFFSPLHIINMSMTFCPRTLLLREADDLLAEQVAVWLGLRQYPNGQIMRSALH